MPYKGNLTGQDRQPPALPPPTAKSHKSNCIAPLRLPATLGESSCCCHCLSVSHTVCLCLCFFLLPFPCLCPPTPASTSFSNSLLQSHWQYLHYDCHFRRLQCWLNGQQFTRKASSIDVGSTVHKIQFFIGWKWGGEGEGAESRTWLSTFLCSQYQTSNFARCMQKCAATLSNMAKAGDETQGVEGGGGGRRQEQLRWYQAGCFNCSWQCCELKWNQVKSRQHTVDMTATVEGEKGEQVGREEREREIDRAGNEFKIPSHVRDNAVAETEAEQDSWRTERMINVSLLICAINLPTFCWPPVKKFSMDYTQYSIHFTYPTPSYPFPLSLSLPIIKSSLSFKKTCLVSHKTRPAAATRPSRTSLCSSSLGIYMGSLLGGGTGRKSF